MLTCLRPVGGSESMRTPTAVIFSFGLAGFACATSEPIDPSATRGSITDEPDGGPPLGSGGGDQGAGGYSASGGFPANGGFPASGGAPPMGGGKGTGGNPPPPPGTGGAMPPGTGGSGWGGAPPAA